MAVWHYTMQCQNDVPNLGWGWNFWCRRQGRTRWDLEGQDVVRQQETPVSSCHVIFIPFTVCKQKKKVTFKPDDTVRKTKRHSDNTSQQRPGQTGHSPASESPHGNCPPPTHTHTSRTQTESSGYGWSHLPTPSPETCV